MGVVNENVEEHILNLSTVIERNSELEGTSATILVWCVQILQSQGLNDLSFIWGLPKN